MGGSCNLRSFGSGLGNSPTKDGAAWDAAIAALNAGFDELVIDAGTFDLTNATQFISQPNKRIRGISPGSSILANTANRWAVHIRGATENVLIQDLGFTGSGKASGLTAQNAIEDGYFGSDGTSNLRVLNCTITGMGGNGVSYAYAPALTGPMLRGLYIDSCLRAINSVGPGLIVKSNIVNCTNGIQLTSGNNVVDGCGIFGCVTGISVTAGGNDGHCVVSNTLIDHSTGDAIVVAAVTNPMTFVGNHIYQGGINLTGVAGTSALVTFLMGIIDLTTFTGNACFAQFDDVRFDDGYFSNTSFTNDCDIEITNTCRYARASKELPAWASALQRQQLTFASDANQTLTRQQNRAQILEVLAGTITVPRKLLGVRAPTKGYRQRVVNRNAQRVDIYGATGTGVQVATGTWHDIEADGTNLIGMGNGSATYTAAP